MKKIVLAAALAAATTTTVTPAQAQTQGINLGSLRGNPWLVAGVIAAAIAIPVAIHNSAAPSTTTP